MPITVTKESILTGRTHSRSISIEQEQFDRWANIPFMERPPIQSAFPMLSVDDREFLLSGITPEEWDEHMGEDDE